MVRWIGFVLLLAAIPLTAQTKSGKAYTAPKTPWGDPDLQGQWPAAANIPQMQAVQPTMAIDPEQFKAAMNVQPVQIHVPPPQIQVPQVQVPPPVRVR